MHIISSLGCQAHGAVLSYLPFIISEVWFAVLYFNNEFDAATQGIILVVDDVEITAIPDQKLIYCMSQLHFPHDSSINIQIHFTIIINIPTQVSGEMDMGRARPPCTLHATP